MVAVIMCRCAPTDQQDLHPGPAAARAKAAIPDLAAELGITTALAAMFLTLIVRAFAKPG